MGTIYSSALTSLDFFWRQRPGRPTIPSETRSLIHEMSRDNRLWGAPRIHGELAKLGINVSRITVAKYMIRRPYPLSPTWRTFIRNQTPEFFLALRFMPSFRADFALCHPGLFEISDVGFHGLSLAGYRSGWRHAISLNKRQDSISVPVALSLDTADYGLVCGRSPPGSRASSPDHLIDTDLPIDVGMADVRMKPAVTNGCAISPNLFLTPQEVGTVQRTDILEQTAA